MMADTKASRSRQSTGGGFSQQRHTVTLVVEERFVHKIDCLLEMKVRPTHVTHVCMSSFARMSQVASINARVHATMVYFLAK